MTPPTWEMVARALWMEGTFDIADEPCDHTPIGQRPGDDPVFCPADDPDCEPCAQRYALRLFREADEAGARFAEG